MVIFLALSFGVWCWPRLMDTIDFEQDQYLTLKGMGSRTEVIAWLKNNRTVMNNLRDVRDMGD